MRTTFIITVVLFCQLPSFGQLTIHPSIISNFNDNGMDNEQAVEIVTFIVDQFQSVQDNIAFISSKSEPYLRRMEMKDGTLGYFEDPTSIIEVSSYIRTTTGNRYTIARRPANVYLAKLLALPYYKVTVYWDESMTLSQLYEDPDGGYEIALGAWQYFSARDKDGKMIITDKTYKKAYFKISKEASIMEIKIREIDVEETRR